jgi:predicted nucleotidyltransferase
VSIAQAGPHVVIASACITTAQPADVTMRLVDERSVVEAIQHAVDALRDAGAKFGYLHGSRVTGSAGSDSDIDIAAYFGRNAPAAFDVLLPPGVDLLVLDHAPLELAGRISLRGRLLFEDDVVARVRWEAMTRKIYFDELPRIARSHQEFAASHRRG